MPESPIRTHLRLVRAGAMSEAAGRLRQAVPESAIVLVGREEEREAEPAAAPPAERPPARSGSALRRHLSVIAGGLTGTGWGLSRTEVPRRAFVLVGRKEPAAAPARMPRRHLLMLVLAAEILCLGALYAANPPRRGVTIDEPLTTGNVVT